MRALAFVALLATALAGQAGEAALQRAFGQGLQALAVGEAARAEALFRRLLEQTSSARVKLELARALHAQGKWEEAGRLFREVSYQPETPWRVRDNIAHFMRDIEERTGYLKLGVTVIADSNPRNLAEQKEFAIGGLRVTPVEAPEKLTGLRYSARGWLPFAPGGTAGFLAASYADYPGQDVDRLTVDLGMVQPIAAQGRVRLKPGLEVGSFGGRRLYRFPYAGVDAVLAQAATAVLTGEAKLGKVVFRDFDYLDATVVSVAASARKRVSQETGVSFQGALERSRARERPYSYDGWDLGPGFDTFVPGWTLMLGARGTAGGRKYAAVDPLFGERREDRKRRLELSVGNKRWRWRDSHVSLVLGVERNHSNIGFFSYRKTHVSLVVE